MKIKRHNVEFQIKVAVIACIYLNISLIKNTISATLGLFFRINEVNTLPIDVCLIVIPMMWYFVELSFLGLSKYQVVSILGWVLLYFFTILFGHIQKDLLIQGIGEGFTHIIVPALLISSMDNLDIFQIHLKKYIPIALYYCVLRIFSISNLTEYSYYTFSYSIIIPMLLCLLLGLTESNKYLIMFGIFLAFIFLYGARGPLLCVIIAFIFSSLILYKNKRVLIASIIAILTLVCLFTFYTQIVSFLISHLPNSRTLQYLNGQWNDSYRSIVWKRIVEEFIDHPFAIHGCMSDRYFISGTTYVSDVNSIKGSYAHNIFMELLYEFGVAGLIISMIIIANIIKNLVKLSRMNQKSDFILFTVLVSFFLGKMMISSSYLIDMSVGGYVGITLYLKEKERYRSNNRGGAMIC